MAGKKGANIWTQAVRRAVKRRIDGVEGKPRKLEHLADKLVEAGLAGDIHALKEIGDRVEGKARQSVDLSSKDGTMTPPTTIELIAVLPDSDE